MSDSFAEGRIGISGRVIAYIILAFFTVLTIGPLVWLLYSSFKPLSEIIRDTLALPKNPTFDNYIRAWKLGKLGLYMVNSIIYTGVATSLTVFFAMSAGYGFAKFGFRITGFFFFFFLMGLLITPHSVLVPLFIMESKIGIDNTRLGVIIPYIAFGLPLAIYICTQYIKAIPNSLEESAIIDGANYLRVFLTLILPISKPVVTTVTILTFLGNWNEFVFVFILTSRDALRSLPVGINSFAGALSVEYGLQFAALVIGTLPMIVFYVIFHRELARGFAEGALKE